jgi:prephenate dehydrogenase (NADP+)
MANRQFPWEIPRYLGGIENVKINVTLRIYANKWHVYAGLAILNPSAQKQIKQYAESVTELFKLMLAGHRKEFSDRIHAAGAAVFKGDNKEDLLLKDEVLDRFSLGEIPEQRVKNNHLSLLAMVDCWWKLGIVPYDHMICSTPVSLSILSLSYLGPYRDTSSFDFGLASRSIYSASQTSWKRLLIRRSKIIPSEPMTSNSPLQRG